LARGGGLRVGRIRSLLKSERSFAGLHTGGARDVGRRRVQAEALTGHKCHKSEGTAVPYRLPSESLSAGQDGWGLFTWPLPLPHGLVGNYAIPG